MDDGERRTRLIKNTSNDKQRSIHHTTPKVHLMAHNFTSGVMLNGEQSWHGLGEVIEGTLPARDAFTRAGALFEVEKAPLYILGPDGTPIQVDSRVAIKRNDNNRVLGTVSPSYEIIQNETLCQMAEMLRDDIIMDTVVVLKDGAKVAFTGKIVGTDTDIIPGDKIHRNIVGYLGHDGYTAFGGIFTDYRVVCQNTLGFAQQDGQRTGKQFVINHNKLGVSQIDDVLRNIDVARQSFGKHIEDYQRMAETPLEYDAFRTWLTHLYAMPAVKMDDGTLRPGEIEDAPVKWNKLRNAWVGGYGSHIDGVQGTVWGAYNAITEVETSLRTEGKLSTRIQSATWGHGARVIERARSSALELVAPAAPATRSRKR
jgi:phage/plasmid-like protein (TIGR03299 family)